MHLQYGGALQVTPVQQILLYQQILSLQKSRERFCVTRIVPDKKCIAENTLNDFDLQLKIHEKKNVA